MQTLNEADQDTQIATAFIDDQMQEFEEQGYVRLGRVATESEIEALCQRIDDIMLGKIQYENMLMQLCPSYTSDSVISKGYKGSTLKYRKIQDLEQDPLFLEHMQRPLFRDITRRLIGEEISIVRAMFFNKPAGGGTRLNWHHDGVSYQEEKSGWGMTIAPRITIWTALDAATVANGCMQIIPGSHHKRATQKGDFLSPEEAALHCPEEKRIFVELDRGEAVLLHNWVLHMSEPNTTDQPRRAFSVCYIDAATRQVPSSNSFPQVLPEYVPVKDKAKVTVSY